LNFTIKSTDLKFEDSIARVLKGCPEGTVFLASVSGGADSIAMLAALCAIVPKDRLFCLHVEHGLRPAQESRGDADHVRNFCEKNGINCIVESVAPGRIEAFARRKGTGIEAAARHFRRRLLFRHAARLDRENGGKTRILIAHTKDDALELALMRVLRGAGPAGLAAMPVNRGRLLRPMLDISRADVIKYLTEKKILWREDSTNTDEKFLRNRVRRRLIPLLNESFPEWKNGLCALAATQSLVAEYFSKDAQKSVTWERAAGGLVTDEKNFFSVSRITREEAVFCGIDILTSMNGEFQAHSIKRSVIRRFCSGSAHAADLGPLLLRRDGGKVALSPKNRDFSESSFSLLIKEPGLYNLNNISIEVRPAGDGSAKNGFVILVTWKEP
jgi:tRNA(Ile)-lysidine synthase